MQARFKRFTALILSVLMMLTCLPIVIFYIIMQKQIIGGLTSDAIKG